MRSKAPLLLMEQMVMLLVFALAAAICLQAFVKSDGLSGASEDRDRAVTLCQEAAEAVRHSGGDLKKTAELLGLSCPYEGDVESLSLGYDKEWNSFGVVTEFGKDVLREVRVTRIDSGVDGLGRAQVEAFAWDDRDGAEHKSIYMIEVAWQVPAASAEVTAEVLAEVEIDDGTAD